MTPFHIVSVDSRGLELKLSGCSFYRPWKVIEASSGSNQILPQMLMVFGGLIFGIFLSLHK
jgi:hypothetical protein